jgi:membrane-bound transcription factor site-1 protease
MKKFTLLIFFYFFFISYQMECIIMLNEYIWTNKHAEFLNHILKKEDFSIIERNNISTQKYPSDFILIHLKNETLLKDLKKNKKIKKIINQERFSKKINRKPLTKKRTTKWSLKDKIQLERKLLMNQDVTEKLQAKQLWDKGFTGQGIKIGVFDTGLKKSNDAFKNIEEILNFTNEPNGDDELGHGTFVAGIIASVKEPKGFAPDSILSSFKVFTSNQVSYTRYEDSNYHTVGSWMHLIMHY